MNYPKQAEELRWLPVATVLKDPTTPSKHFLQKLSSKYLVHDNTVLRAQETYLIFQVGDEAAVVGDVGQETFLGEIFESKRPKKVDMSCSDLLRLFVDANDDETEADKTLKASIQLDLPKKENEDEGEAFFRALCSHIKDRILYRSEETQSNTSPSNKTTKKDGHAIAAKS